MPSPLDLEAVEELRGLMAEDFDGLVRAFLTDSAARMADIQAALPAPDRDKLRRAAHSLKGMCLNMGARPFARVLAELEAAARNARTDALASLWSLVSNEYTRTRSAVEELITPH